MTEANTDQPTERIPAGQMPPWEVGELPEPPKMDWRPATIIGPGLMMVGAAIGGGEWLMGPAATARYGGIIMCVATLSILCQVVYNLGVMRYTIYCGEPIFVGFFRLLPGPKFWTGFYLFLDFFAVWPYLSASAAVPLNAAFLNHMPGSLPTSYATVTEVVERTGLPVETVREMKEHPERFQLDPQASSGQKPIPEPIRSQLIAENRQTQWISYGVFLLAFVPLIFGGKVYNSLEKLMVVKIILVLGFLTFLGIFFVSWETWAEVFAGFFFFGKDSTGAWGFRLPKAPAGQEIDWALLAGFAAIAGIGGLNNSQLSTYSRDKGWGMGAQVGAVPSMIGGVGISLSHTGKVFRLNRESLRRWKGWMRFIGRDQWVIWAIGCVLGMAIPSLISLQFLRGVEVPGREVPAATARAILSEYPQFPILWILTLLCGFIVLAPAQVTTVDGLVRRWTDVLWVGNRHLRMLEGHKVKLVYYGLLGAYAIWGIIVLIVLPEPLIMTKVSGVLINFGLGFSAFHTLAVIRILMPRELRPKLPMQLGLVVCGLFFIGISAIGLTRAYKDVFQVLEGTAF